MSNIKLIVGLGNPGKNYTDTRHNIGFLTVQHMVERLGFKFRSGILIKGQIAEGVVDGVQVCFLLPMMFMNNSGIPVKKVVAKKGISLDNTIIICDDLNLGFQQIRLKAKGSAGGHNGLRSLIQCLGSQDFPRLRMGISHPGERDQVTDFVLGKFNTNEKEHLEGFIQEAAECCHLWLREGASKTMDKYNRRNN